MMLRNRLRRIGLACGVAVVLLAMPTQSRGCGCILQALFGGCGACTSYSAPAYASSYAPAYSGSTCSSCATGTYAPAYTAPACSSCTPQTTYYRPQTVYYQPQTSYSTVYRQVPVTTYGTYSSVNSCSGCQTTYYRPVTTWTYQAVSVPYTSYRVIASDACNPCGSYNGCSTCSVGSSSCSTCTSGVTVNKPQMTSEASESADTNDTPAPTTFQEETTPVESFKPVPIPGDNEADENESTSGPDLPNPAARTTMRPIQQAVHYVPIAPSQDQLPEVGVWRVVRD